MPNLESIMLLRICALLCVLFTIAETKAFAKRDVSSQPNNAVVSIQRNLDNFRRCIDQTLATAIGDVNEKQLQPVFSVIGDSLNRVSKAFDDLTATTKKPDPFLDF